MKISLASVITRMEKNEGSPVKTANMPTSSPGNTRYIVRYQTKQQLKRKYIVNINAEIQLKTSSISLLSLGHSKFDLTEVLAV